jgi:hypothetical protein
MLPLPSTAETALILLLEQGKLEAQDLERARRLSAQEDLAPDRALLRLGLVEEPDRCDRPRLRRR